VSGNFIRQPRAPLVILAVLLAATAGMLAVEAARLPEIVAVHFGGGGEPDGWVERSAHLLCSAFLGFVLPLVPAGSMVLALRLPVKFINLPNKAHWLAPERRAETQRWMIRHMFWLGCLLACLHLFAQGMILAANAQTPPRLAGSLVLGLTGGFLAAAATWVMVFWRRFARVPQG